MRRVLIILGLTLILAVGALTWVTTQLTAGVVLDAAAERLDKDGIELTHEGLSTLSVFPNIQLDVAGATLVTPETEAAKAQRIRLEGLRFQAPLLALLATQRGAITLDRLFVDTIELSQVSSDVILRDGVILPNIDAILWRGALAGSAVVDTSVQPMTIATQGSLTGADAASVIATMGDIGQAQGQLNADWDLTLTPSERDEDPVQATGEIRMIGEQIALTSTDLSGAVCSAISRAQGKRAPRANPKGTVFDRIELVQTHSGVSARIDTLRLETATMTVTATGRIDRQSTVFSAQASAKLHADAINAIPNCRVSDKLADIAWPVICEGKTHNGDPKRWCRVDVSSVLEQGLKSELKRRFNLDDPRGLIQSLIRQKSS